MTSLPQGRKISGALGPRTFSKSGSSVEVDESWTQVGASPSKKSKSESSQDIKPSAPSIDRGPSLVEIHQQSKAPKRTTERLPFNRERDLTHRPMDAKKRQSIIQNSATQLSSNFTSGKRN